MIKIQPGKRFSGSEHSGIENRNQKLKIEIDFP
jgi:hypothetical protein